MAKKKTVATSVKTRRYDVAESLRTPEEMAAYLEACFEEADGDAAFVAKALGDIARARGTDEPIPGTELTPRVRAMIGSLKGAVATKEDYRRHLKDKHR